MKIVHISVAHNRYDARIIRRQAVSQKNAGWDVVFVCADGKPEEVFNGVHIVSYSNHRFSKGERFKCLLFKRTLVNYLLNTKADIYQFHDFELIEVGRALRNRGQHVIFDSHENWLDLIPLYLPTKAFQWIGRRLLNRYYHKVVSCFDAVFSVSPNMVERLKKYNPHSYMVSNYPFLQKTVKTNIGEKKNEFVYQGTVYSFSNQIPTVKAISLLEQDARYKVIGSIADTIKQSILENDTNHKVDFIGWVDKDKLDEIMSAACCGIVILDYLPVCCGKEGQLGSNKIFEYMNLGLPVICTNFTLWRELIIDKYNCGICVEPGDIDQIKKAMVWILNNPDEARLMGERGRSAIINEFNWENGLDTYLSYYGRIVQNSL